ncbi:hypothetical protein [Methylobacterium aquaticum]|jgi:hypothetical protein|uniref:Uncharacterized protein n=1 Tax=Methylobacterium aquaticum TaxID=270351 RepID=A0A0J6V5X7_9HYPH|nr:hypothetical protein [Methylobacterium aquaticum]KMO34316.1 hypothetical protein VP06_14720 [Methylobacterium aquaticum]
MTNGQIHLRAERVREMIHVIMGEGRLGMRSARTLAEAEAFANALLRMVEEIRAEQRTTADNFS